MIRYPLQVIVDFQPRDDQAQIALPRFLQRKDVDHRVVDLQLQGIHALVVLMTSSASSVFRSVSA
jgi:hypothetical protein